MSGSIRFPLPADLLRRLPRHPDWKYERIDGEAWLSPRPRPLRFLRATDLPVTTTPCGDIEIRRSESRRDRDGIAKLLLEVWAEEDPYRSMPDRDVHLHAEIERSLLAQDLGVLAADVDGICAAALLLPGQAGTPTLTWLTVRRDARDRGLATSLLGFLVHTLPARGVGALASATSAANIASLRWHLSRGFELADDPLRAASSRF